MQHRFNALLKWMGLLLAAGLIYAWFFLKTGIGVPCVLHLVTGLYCPGCGISRMCIALFQLDFGAALRSNLGVLLCLPGLLLLAVCLLVQYLKAGHLRLARWQNVLVYSMIAVLLVFGVLRNFPAFWFLQPL